MPKNTNTKCPITRIRQRLDVRLNFIGEFEVPAEIVRPMGIEEQRRIQGEQAAREKRQAETEEEWQARHAKCREAYNNHKAALPTVANQ